jgi:hypothetical protein
MHEEAPCSEKEIILIKYGIMVRLELYNMLAHILLIEICYVVSRIRMYVCSIRYIIEKDSTPTIVMIMHSLPSKKISPARRKEGLC